MKRFYVDVWKWEVRKGTAILSSSANRQCVYSHVFDTLPEAMTALGELHRDYKGDEYQISFQSFAR